MHAPAALASGSVLDAFASQPPEAAWVADLDAAREAETAALAAAFAMFGTPSPHREGQDAEGVVSAQLAFQDSAGPSQPPANEAAALVFPPLPPRGLRLDAKLAMRLAPCFDWIVVGLAAEFAALWGAGTGLLQLSLGEAASFLLAALSLKLGLWATGAYAAAPARVRPDTGAAGLALGAVVALCLANFIAPDARAAAALAAVIPAAALLSAGLHAALALWLRAAHHKGMFAENVVIVGATETARRLVEQAQRTGDARVVALADDRLARAPAQIGAAPLGGGVAALLGWEHLPHIDRVIVALPVSADARVGAILDQLKAAPNRVDLMLAFPSRAVSGQTVERLAGAALVCVSGRAPRPTAAAAKRCVDLMLGASVLIAAAPLLIGLALAIRLESKGPALLGLRRYGRNNRAFSQLRFRTERPVCGATTRVGSFLLRTGLVDAPQLINVVKGEMSLVGPAALTRAQPSVDAAMHAQRQRLRPGLTGWAQVNGADAANACHAAVRRRLALDLHHVTRPCLWFELKILARSIELWVGRLTQAWTWTAATGARFSPTSGWRQT